MLVVEDRLKFAFGNGHVRGQQDAVAIEDAVQFVDGLRDDDVGVEIVDPLGAELAHDVLERGPLDRRAKLDDPVAEDPAREIRNRQVCDVDDRVKCGRGLGRAIGHRVREHEVERGPRVHPLDRMRQGRGFGKVVRGDTCEDMHGRSFAQIEGHRDVRGVRRHNLRGVGRRLDWPLADATSRDDDGLLSQSGVTVNDNQGTAGPVPDRRIGETWWWSYQPVRRARPKLPSKRDPRYLISRFAGR